MPSSTWATSSWSHQLRVMCFLLEGLVRQFPEDPEAPAAPECQHYPVSVTEGWVHGRGDEHMFWWLLLPWWQTPTLGPGRPIPVSPWIPGGPGSPLSPYKTNTPSLNYLFYYRHQYLLYMSPNELYGGVPPCSHLNMCFHYMYDLTAFKVMVNTHYGIPSWPQSGFY